MMEPLNDGRFTRLSLSRLIEKKNSYEYRYLAGVLMEMIGYVQPEDKRTLFGYLSNYFHFRPKWEDIEKSDIENGIKVQESVTKAIDELREFCAKWCIIVACNQDNEWDISGNITNPESDEVISDDSIKYFDIGEWFKTPQSNERINVLLKDFFSVKHCIYIENRTLIYKTDSFGDWDSSGYGIGMFCVVLSSYQTMIVFNRAELRQDWMKYFSNILNSEKAYQVKLDTSILKRNTFCNGGKIAFLNKTDLNSVFNDFKYTDNYHKIRSIFKIQKDTLN